jgi:hypothetical protein
MLRGCSLLWAAVLTTGCQTLREADAAMGAWTREHFAEDAEEPEKGEQASSGVKAAKQDAGPERGNDPRNAASTSQSTPQPAPTPTIDEARAVAAEALFESGHEAMSQGDYDTACARFEESNRLEPAVGAVLNLAACEEKRGRLATAWQLFKRVMSDLPPGDDRYPIAQRRASELRPRVPWVTLMLEIGAPKQTTVTYGRVVLGTASFNVPLPFDPGAHTLTVGAPKREQRTYTVELEEGETETLTVAPGDPKP